MNIRTTLILVLILGLLGGYYYVFEVKKAEENKVKEEESKKVFNLVSYDISSFNYTNKDEGIENAEFVKKGEEWFLTKPIEYKGNFQVIDYIVNTTGNLKFDEKIEDAGDLAEYGLKESKVKVAFKKSNGETETLNLGEKTPTGSGVYVMSDKSKNIYMVSSDNHIIYTKKLFDLRNQDLIKFNESEINFLKISKSDNSFFLKKENDKWYIEEPEKLSADNDKVKDLISKIDTNKVSEFVSDTPTSEDLKKYGFEKPIINIAFGKEKSNLDKQIIIANEIGDYNYVKNNSYQTIFKVNKALSEGYKNLTLNDLRDKTLITFDTNKVKKIIIDSVDKKIEASQDKEHKWKLDKAEKSGKLTADDIGALAGKLSSLKFKRLFSSKDVTLGSTIINVTIEFEGNDKPIKLTFGSKTKDNEAEVYMIKESDTETVYAVEKSVLEKLL